MQDLINKLPHFYENEITKPIIDAEQKEREVLFQEIHEVLEQCFVSTATWGLSYWERLLCIPVNEAKSVEQRRSDIYTKMRGTRTTTMEVIRQIARAFLGTEDVVVTEDNENYAFTLDFENTRGLICNLNSLYSTIDIYKPAHLNYYITFTNKKQLQIITNQYPGNCLLPICNITNVGTYWKNQTCFTNATTQHIESQMQVGRCYLPICGVHRLSFPSAEVGSARVGESFIGGE